MYLNSSIGRRVVEMIKFYYFFLFIFLCSLSLFLFEVQASEESSNFVNLNGRFLILEKFFLDSPPIFENYLFVNENGEKISYQLVFEEKPQNLMDFSGKDVVVEWKMDSIIPQSNMDKKEKSIIHVSEISLENDLISVQSLAPSSINTIVLLNKFSDKEFEPHELSYFEERFFGTGDSLKNYWKNSSYEKFDWDGDVQPWRTLPSSYSSYGPSFFDFETAASDAIGIHDSFVDFNSYDQIIFVYNEIFHQGFTAFGSLGKVSVSTNDGTKDYFLIHTPDNPSNSTWFPLGINFERGIGVMAHETGHNFGWEHSLQPSPWDFPPFDDEWSLMSGGAPKGPDGVVSFYRDDAGWISQSDIITISNGESITFSLDYLSDDSPGPNYLMAKIPFGTGSDYYTLEARTDSTFDRTPQAQTGVMIYHIKPSGHSPGFNHPKSPVLLVVPDDRTANPLFDFDNADLDVGQVWNDPPHNIIVNSIEETIFGITVFVSNNGGDLPDLDGDGIPDSIDPLNLITSDTTLASNHSVMGSVLVQNGATLEIPFGLSLTIPGGQNLTIQFGSGVLIKDGGALQINS